MVDRVFASEYRGRTDSGKSRPMLCSCEDSAGNIVNLYVKGCDFYEGLSTKDLACELVGNNFAIDLNLPAATPYTVEVGPDFIKSLPADPDGDELRKIFRSARHVAFGSKQFTPVRRWVSGDMVQPNQVKEACDLYLLDTLIENTDRGHSNPNLLINGSDFKIIDFGQCLMRCHEKDQSVYGPLPWQKGGILNHINGNNQHIMLSAAKKANAKVFIDFFQNLSALDDNTIQDYLSAVPPEWCQDTACRIIDYLLEARSHASEFMDFMKGVLQ